MKALDFACFQTAIKVRTPVRRQSQREKFICCAKGPDVEKHPSSREKRRTKRKPPASLGSRSIADVAVGDEFIGTVCDVGPANSSWIDIGVATLSGRQVNARLRLSHVGKSKGAVPGSLIPVYVHELDRASARIGVRPGLSSAAKDIAVAQETKMLDSVQLGEQMKGTIVGVGKYGAVVDVNVYRNGRKGRRVPITGLLPRNCFKRTWASEADLVTRSDVDKVVKVGDQIDVWVRDASVPNARLLLGADAVDADSILKEKQDAIALSRRQRRRPSPSTLEINSVRFGKVKSTAPYGLFVDIGVKSNGLIHFSRMGDLHRGNWQDSIPVGSEVSVRVLDVNGDRIELELISVAGDDHVEEQIYPAIVRGPSAKDTVIANEQAPAVSTEKESARNGPPKRDSVQPELSINQDDKEKVKEDIRNDDDARDEEEEEYEKFSDEYFEDKYGF
eukprot:GFKZ01009111.1.p2 GENE.GFKZ01009111.1~~GFKZ01009111.1.p2  ORF type:complete len:447 (+),score=53.68 GFKZ01009111.1:449-1789(+)